MNKASQVDFVVMGAGIAGLRTAIELARHGDVLVVIKESLHELNTHHAQNGIAEAIEGDADMATHLEGTVNAGDGLVHHPAAEALVLEGPLRVAELIEWSAVFGTESGQTLRSLESEHSPSGIQRASVDTAAAEIYRTLTTCARELQRLKFAEWTMVTGLVVADGRVVGVELAPAGPPAANQTPYRLAVRAVLIADGGAGQVYGSATNPPSASGDGIALAAAAGAELADMEFCRFHSTAPATQPSAQYFIGGIKTDLNGRTSLVGLYAAGEAACTGVHGADGLASNALLEELVFGARAAQAIGDDHLPFVDLNAIDSTVIPLTSDEEVLLEKQIAELQSAMLSYAGTQRQNLFLLEGFAAQAEFADALKKLVRAGKSSRRLHEALTINRAAHAILHSALARTESRGTHFRKDFPKRDDMNFQKHSVFRSGESSLWSPSGKVTFEAW